MADELDFSGIWRSTYRYHDSKRGGDFDSEHYVTIERKGNQLIVHSVPGSKSYLLVRLSLDDGVATGSWEEQTEKDGHYKGALYRGALQFVIADDGHFQGKWVGVGRDTTVHDGAWAITRIAQKKGKK